MADDMNLPEGRTCEECAHFNHCVLLFNCLPLNTNCDWSPSRFKLATEIELAALHSRVSEAESRSESAEARIKELEASRSCHNCGAKCPTCYHIALESILRKKDEALKAIRDCSWTSTETLVELCNKTLALTPADVKPDFEREHKLRIDELEARCLDYDLRCAELEAKLKEAEADNAFCDAHKGDGDIEIRACPICFLESCRRFSEAEKALEFYADEGNWVARVCDHTTSVKLDDEKHSQIAGTPWLVAQEALARLRGENQGVAEVGEGE